MRVLRKAACRPLNLKFFLKSTRPSFIDKAGCIRQFESELSLRSLAQLFPIKEGSTSHLGLLPSGEKRKPLLLVALNRYAIWLADHQRSTPAAELRFLCGMNRMDTLFRMFAACSMLKGCLLDACCLLELLFEGTADKMDGALRNLLILASYSP